MAQINTPNWYLQHIVLFITFSPPGFSYQSLIWFKSWQDISIGNILLSALLPIVYQLKVEIIDLINLISVIIVFCYFEKILYVVKQGSFYSVSSVSIKSLSNVFVCDTN